MGVAGKGLDRRERRRHGRSALPWRQGFEIACSQGRVEFLTGGDPSWEGKPASAWNPFGFSVSRSGVIPEPTVTVRMEENELATTAGRHATAAAGSGLRPVACRFGRVRGSSLLP